MAKAVAAKIEEKHNIGLDQALIGSIDWSLSAKRLVGDMKSDFIFSPHLQFVFEHASAHIIHTLQEELKNGKFYPRSPIHIEVPKSSRFKSSGTERRGPSFSRQGSILLPKDRLFYQILGDILCPYLEDKLDRKLCFSNQLNPPDSEGIFKATRTCWTEFQNSIQKQISDGNFNFVLRTDVASCFASINQHTLVDLVRDSGAPNSAANALEKILVRYTGAFRSSRGILQGLSTSDILGNFYLHPIDTFLAKEGRPSYRYVDDMYIFEETAKTAESFTRPFIEKLRMYDLSLNEQKSSFMTAKNLLTDEPDLELLFQAAIEEITGQFDEDEENGGYGFQIDWDNSKPNEEETSDEEIELKATIKLFEGIDEYPGQSETIERFCLPLFSRAQSEYAIPHVLETLSKKPSMTQIYCSYLSNFTNEEQVVDGLKKFLIQNNLFSWQVLWVIATFLKYGVAVPEVTERCLEIFKDGSAHEGVRAVAVIYAGRYGNLDQRKEIAATYPSVGSDYLKSATYFATRWFKGAERSTMTKAYGNDTELNVWIDAGVKNFYDSKKSEE